MVMPSAPFRYIVWAGGQMGDIKTLHTNRVLFDSLGMAVLFTFYGGRICDRKQQIDLVFNLTPFCLC